MARLRRMMALAFLATALAVPASARDMAVVVNKVNAQKTVPAADLTKIVKAATKKWPDGKDIVIVMKDPSMADMKMVLQKLFAMSADEAKAHITANKKTFLIVNSDADVLKAVTATPGAVGLLDVYSINSTVSVLKVDGKLPLEPGYLLHGS